MERLGADSKVFVGRSVYARAFGDGEMVLLEFGRGEYFGLDEVGCIVWRELEKGRPLGAIADVVADQFDVTREQALRDIIALVAEMRENALVQDDLEA